MTLESHKCEQSLSTPEDFWKHFDVDQKLYHVQQKTTITMQGSEKLTEGKRNGWGTTYELQNGPGTDYMVRLGFIRAPRPQSTPRRSLDVYGGGCSVWRLTHELFTIRETRFVFPQEFTPVMFHTLLRVVNIIARAIGAACSAWDICHQASVFQGDSITPERKINDFFQSHVAMTLEEAAVFFSGLSRFPY